MKKEYLKDSDFLKFFDTQRLKAQYAKIIVLNWAEEPIKDITAIITGGNINLDKSSSLRRTCNLNVYIEDTEVNVTNPNYLLSLNKKVRIEIGVENNTEYYKDEDIVWFPIGMFVICGLSVSHGTNGTSINLQLKDKMCLLNGDAGGSLPAAITFSEIESTDENGTIVISKPTMYQIIQELVNHWGGEQLGNIIISDLDTRVKKVMKWTGTTPLYRYKAQGDTDSSFLYTTNLETAKTAVGNNENMIDIYKYGTDVGYIYSDFYYPGEELVSNPGDSIVSVLDTICSTLGNFEYFYDIDGNFIFQEIKNYLNNSYSSSLIKNLDDINYLIDQTKGATIYDFDNADLITSYSNNPQLNMIYNDFIVWGERETATGITLPIRYHIAIDDVPIDFSEREVFKYLDPDDNIVKAKQLISIDSIENQSFSKDIFYICNNKIYKGISDTECVEVEGEVSLIKPIDYRTEFYLQGVEAEPFGIDSNYYYTELKNEWVKLYDIWNNNFYDEIQNTPSNCDYFLDIIDSNSKLGDFSISSIGRRTKAVTDDKVNCIFAPDIEDIIIIDSEDENLQYLITECNDRNQEYSIVANAIYSCLSVGGALNSAYDAIRNLLYQYTSYNESVSIQCIPIYHLEPNTLIRIADPQSNINGNYLINSISIPLDIAGTMTISAIKALDKI